MTRNHSWVEDLHHYLAAQVGKAFCWGTHDCALFVCGAIEAMTGIDVAAEFRGRYRSALGAARITRQVTGTGNTVEDAAKYVTAKYGMEQLSAVLLAQRGDVVLHDGDEGPALGIVSLNGKDALFVTEAAMRRIPLRECRAAWRV